MSKLRRYYYGAVDAVSGGRVYHARWMFKLGILPVPLWTVVSMPFQFSSLVPK